MNILISVNKNYLKKATTMLYSLCVNTQEKVVVYLLHNSLSGEEVVAFRRKVRIQCGAEIFPIQVKNTIFDSCTLGQFHFSIEMYYRILAHEFLPKNIQRILWLDADLIVQKALADFYYQDFGETYIVVCADAKSATDEIQQLKKRLGLSKNHVYFNSGVLLLNLEKLRQDVTEEQLSRCVAELEDRLTYPDQDILNVFYSGKVKYADWKPYNYQIGTVDHPIKSEYLNATIVHYTGPWKPWSYKCINPYSGPYWMYRYRQGYLIQTIWAYMRHLIYVPLRQVKIKLFGEK